MRCWDVLPAGRPAVVPVHAEQVTAAPKTGEAKVLAASTAEDTLSSTGSKIEAGAAVSEPEPEPEGHTTSTGYDRCRTERLQATLSFDTVPGGGGTMVADVKAETVGCSPNHPEPDQIADVTPRTQIVGVLKQVHPGMGITSAGRLILEELLFGHMEPQLVSSAWQRVRQRLADSRQVPHVSLAEAAAISPADLVEAVRLHLPGELAKHGNAEGTRALTKFHQSTLEDEPEMAATAHSSRAGLVFCVQRSARQLWQQTGAHGGGPSDSMLSAAVFLAAVNEYICAEILELSGNAARDYKKCNIAPRHIFLAIRYDEELNKQFKDFAILGGGVVPVVKLAALLSVYCTKSELNYWLSQCRTFTLCCHRAVSWHAAATTAQLIGLFWRTRP